MVAAESAVCDNGLEAAAPDIARAGVDFVDMAGSPLEPFEVAAAKGWSSASCFGSAIACPERPEPSPSSVIGIRGALSLSWRSFTISTPRNFWIFLYNTLLGPIVSSPRETRSASSSVSRASPFISCSRNCSVTAGFTFSDFNQICTSSTVQFSNSIAKRNYRT